MYFLINYSRKDGVLVNITEFSDRAVASKAKLELEILSLNSSLSNEIVILEADSVDALMASHSRYFKDLSSIQIEREESKGR